MTEKKKKLVFENGREFYGVSFGADTEAVYEVIINTSMVGYQEIVSDPGYCGKMVLMTYPLIGNCGLADEDYESKTPMIGGLIVREYNDFPSNFRYTKTLEEELSEYWIPGICGVDTREIARMIKAEGTLRAMLTDAEKPLDEVRKAIAETPRHTAQISDVSCKKRWYSRTPNFKYNIVAIDCGIAHSLIESLNSRGCNVIVVPYDITVEELLALHPDGVMISNGPGNPEEVPSVISLIQSLNGELPLFGLDFGFLAIAYANGAKIVRMKTGHHGSNHPAKNLRTGKTEIISQNHSYTVDEASLEKTPLNSYYKNLLDGTVEGIENESNLVMAVQFHPESSPGASDSAHLFDRFLEMIERNNQKRGKQNA